MLAFVAGCRGGDGDPAVDRVWIDDPEAHFGRDYVELLPPIALPSNDAAHPQVSVRAALPEAGEIELVSGPNGDVLRFPPGTTMERLEWVGSGDVRSLTDVRGTSITPDGEIWHHNYRRTRLAPNAALVGYRWRADDPAAHDRAVGKFVAELSELPPAVSMSAGGRGAYLDGLRKKANCTACHVPSRPRNDVVGAHGLVNRGTDASGFFTPQTVFTDDIVLEDYGRFDLNMASPFVTFSCQDGATPSRAERRSGGLRMSCGRSVVLAHYDLKAALAAGDRRAKRVCASRRALAAHLDDEALERLEHAIRMCESNEG